MRVGRRFNTGCGRDRQEHTARTTPAVPVKKGDGKRGKAARLNSHACCRSSSVRKPPLDVANAVNSARSLCRQASRIRGAFVRYKSAELPMSMLLAGYSDLVEAVGWCSWSSCPPAASRSRGCLYLPASPSPTRERTELGC